MDETTAPQTGEVAPTSFDEAGAAQALLSRWKEREQPAEQPPEAPTAPESAAADEPEAEEATEGATTPEEPADVEIDFRGKKFKLPRAHEEVANALRAEVREIEAGATRKFQEAADLRKATEAERAAVVEMRKIAEKTADLLADHRAIARRMQQLEQIDINATDAETLARYNAEYTQLTAASKRIEATYGETVRTMKDEEAKAFRARQEHAERIVSQRIKGWGPELQKELAEYAIGRGAPAEALQMIDQPYMVEILADAAYGRKMREHKTANEKRVAQAPPTLKPGPAAGLPSGKVKAEAAMATLRKSGRTEDAAAALLARLRK